MVGRVQTRDQLQGATPGSAEKLVRATTLGLSLFQGLSATGLRFSLDRLCLGLRATGESRTCLPMDVVTLIYVRVGPPLVDSEAWPTQAEGLHYLQLESRLKQEESATGASPRDPQAALKFRQGLWS